MKYINHILLIGIMILGSCSVPPDYAITEGELTEHVGMLASEEFAGRYPGTKGDSLAADYIRDAFKNYGLDLLGDDGYQKLEIAVEVEIGENNRLSWSRMDFTIGEDFIPLSFSSNATVSGEIVFAGYGLDIDVEGFSRNDFSSIDISGKIVVLLQGGPEIPESVNQDLSNYLLERTKMLKAKDLGASAVIFVAGPLYSEEDQLKFLNRKEAPTTIPAIYLARNAADKILSVSGSTVEALEQENQVAVSTVQNLMTEVTLETDVRAKISETQNVVARVVGEGPNKNSRIFVIGAHYDHLGMGGEGSSSRVPDTIAVHYGADDNASGVSVVLELAGVVENIKKELNSTYIFVAFTGEEMGLIGSKYFVNNPLCDPNDLCGMINLDMVGRLNDEKTLTISGTGTALEFESMLHSVLKPEFKVSYSKEGYGPSDHASFYSKDKPVLYFSTGAHLDYHTPGDTAEKINYPGMKIIADQLFELILALDQSEKLTFQEAGPKAPTGGRANMKVTLGIMPDFTGTGTDGLRVDFVRSEGPAGKAGMLKGDKIVGLNGLSVGNIQEYMTRMNALEPGQTVSVEVVREGKNIVLLAKL